MGAIAAVDFEKARRVRYTLLKTPKVNANCSSRTPMTMAFVHILVVSGQSNWLNARPNYPQAIILRQKTGRPGFMQHVLSVCSCEPLQALCCSSVRHRRRVR